MKDSTFHPSTKIRPVSPNRPLAIGAIGLSLVMSVHAQGSIQWTGTSNTTISACTNWSGGVAPVDDLTSNTALFNGTVTAPISL